MNLEDFPTGENQEELPLVDAEPIDLPEEPEEEMETVRPSWPLRIATIGAPGSGKAEFAAAFAELSADFFAEHDSELAVIPNGGTMIEELGQQAVGFFGDYREHLMAFFLALAEEHKAMTAGKSIFLNGTALTNLAHAVANFEVIQLGLDTSGIVTPQTQARIQQAQTTLAELTFLMAENFSSQFVFRMPLPPIVEVPGQDVGLERRYAARVDAALTNLCGGFFLSPQVLDGTPEERAAAAMETIERIIRDGVQVPKAIADQRPDLTA